MFYLTDYALQKNWPNFILDASETDNVIWLELKNESLHFLQCLDS